MNAQISTQLAPEFAPEFEIQSPFRFDAETVLTNEARSLLVMLHRKFNTRRLALLRAREQRQRELDGGLLPYFLKETRHVRAGNWRIGTVPQDLQDRRVEITGPTDRKMIINALNAPVQAFMADFEDSTSPTWGNIIRGQANLRDAVNRTISYCDPASGKHYSLGEHTATLIVRPRGWHLPEKHILIDGEPVSAALFDFAVYIVNNHEALLKRGSGPYFYLPKMENHLEARLWNDVFLATQDHLLLSHGTIKVTALIETILAAFEMDEILFELRQHIIGLNCGRWDYIFSYIKKFRNNPNSVLPDRSNVTMGRHFLKSYVDLLIRTCHRRGAHAMGGMAAQIPLRDDPEAHALAMDKVLADKLREVNAGHDGTWIAHPGLAAVAYEAFNTSRAPHQLHVSRDDVMVVAEDLLHAPEGEITEAGMRYNIRVGVQYLEAWLEGSGCVPLYGMMEDTATAEICRAQLWQWVKHGACTDDGQVITAQRVEQLITEEVDALRRVVDAERFASGSFATAARLFGQMVRREQLDDFLTLPAYEYLP